MGKIIEDSNSNLVKHLPDMPKDRILLDDITKLRWEWLGNVFPIPSHYPESHHIE